MSDSNTTQTKEGFFEVTEADYQEQLAAGIEDEFILKPGRYKFFRGRHPNFKPSDLEPRNTRVNFTLPLALDVFKYFERRAADLRLDSYTTLINDTLRAAMERELADQASAQLLADDGFIKAVAAQVRALNATGRKRKRAAKSKPTARRTTVRSKTVTKPKAKTA